MARCFRRRRCLTGRERGVRHRIGRVQVLKAVKPYARAAFATNHTNIFGYWNSRTSVDPQIALSSGAQLEERSDIFQHRGTADLGVH